MSTDDEYDARRTAIRDRLARLGYIDEDGTFKGHRWQRDTGLIRQTVDRLLDGAAKTQRGTFDSIEKALDRLEASNTGQPTPTVTPLPGPQVVTFRVSGDFGVDVAVSGPVDNIDELRETVEKLIRGMHPGARRQD